MAGRGGTFAAWSHRDYRWLLTGNFISFTGDWLDQIALNWLVIATTGDPLAVAAVNLARGVPLVLFALTGGVIADRMDRRRLLMLTQALAFVLALILALLVALDRAPLWAVIALATGRGLIVAFNTPARHSLVPDLVPREALASAVALNSLAMNSAKVLGPLLAAGILALWGTAICFALNALTFLILLLILFRMRLAPHRPKKHEPFVRAFAAGFSYLAENRLLGMIVLANLVPAFFAQPYVQMLALYTHEVLGQDSSVLGILVAIAACGAICGGLLAARVQAQARRGDVMLLFMGGFGLGVMALAAAPGLITAALALFAAGLMHVACNSTNNTLIQLMVDEGYRGRVVAILFTTRGLMPLGAASIAALSALLGPRLAIGGMAGVVTLFAAILWYAAPALRRLRV